MSDPRFFIDHGTIHDRLTGKHVRTSPDDGYEDGITACCALLNSLDTASDAARIEGAKEARAALEFIANHPHNAYSNNAGAASAAEISYYRHGVTDGHRCAAGHARDALAKLTKGATDER